MFNAHAPRRAPPAAVFRLNSLCLFKHQHLVKDTRCAVSYTASTYKEKRRNEAARKNPNIDDDDYEERLVHSTTAGGGRRSYGRTRRASAAEGPPSSSDTEQIRKKWYWTQRPLERLQ